MNVSDEPADSDVAACDDSARRLAPTQSEIGPISQHAAAAHAADAASESPEGDSPSTGVNVDEGAPVALSMDSDAAESSETISSVVLRRSARARKPPD